MAINSFKFIGYRLCRILPPTPQSFDDSMFGCLLEIDQLEFVSWPVDVLVSPLRTSLCLGNQTSLEFPQES